MRRRWAGPWRLDRKNKIWRRAVHPDYWITTPTVTRVDFGGNANSTISFSTTEHFGPRVP